MEITLPKTNSKMHLKLDGKGSQKERWQRETDFLLVPFAYFQRLLLAVSFREDSRIAR